MMKQKNYGLDMIVHILTHPLFAILWLGLAVASYFIWDQPLARFMHTHQNHGLTLAAETITRLGLGGPYLLISALVFLLSRFFRYKPKIAAGALFIFLAVVISGVLCLLVKISLARARPTLLFQEHLYGFYLFQFKASMWSFPSGHSLTIASVALAASLLWPRYWPGFFLLMFLVAASRIILTAHYLSDVMIGLYVGALIAIFIARKLHNVSWLEFFRLDPVSLGPTKNRNDRNDRVLCR